MNLKIKVLLDSSILLLSVRKGIDLFNEIEKLFSTNVEFIIITPVLGELKRLKRKKGRLGSEASYALDNIKENCIIKEWRTGGAVDQSIADACVTFSSSVATADVKLMRNLRRKRVPVIILRRDRLHCEPETPEYWDLYGTLRSIKIKRY